MKSIFLSAGHSNADPGAVANGRRESDMAVEFRNIVSFYLTQKSIPHTVDGRGTVNIPLRQAVKSARGFDIPVEFHCNASVSTAATGCEVLSDTGDAVLAAKISAAISASLGIRNRGAKPEDSGQHKRLAFVQAGGLIVEILFITSKSDLARYDARKWVAARAVAEVLYSAAH